VLLWLTALALVTRLLWVLVIHPPGDYVFSDMGMYVKRARDLVNIGVQSGVRDLAWQAYGTHFLLALPFKIFGPGEPYRGAAVLWGLLGAAAVPLSYLVACRVLPTARLAKIAGVLALLWYPNLSTTGFFLSETPFLCLQLLAVYWLLRVLQEGVRRGRPGSRRRWRSCCGRSRRSSSRWCCCCGWSTCAGCRGCAGGSCSASGRR
jgi:hypothetical protein